MKKTYITPSLQCMDVMEEEIIASSIRSVSYDGGHGILIDEEDAADGAVSDVKGSFYD